MTGRNHLCKDGIYFYYYCWEEIQSELKDFKKSFTQHTFTNQLVYTMILGTGKKAKVRNRQLIPMHLELMF